MTTLLAQCLHDTPSKRPSSLTLLQISRKQLAAVEQKEMPTLLPERSVGTDYIFQAILELLERFFHSFDVIESAKLRSDDCWGLNRPLSLALVLGGEDKAKLLLLENEAVWECPWNAYGLTPKAIAVRNGFSIVKLLDSPPATSSIEDDELRAKIPRLTVSPYNEASPKT